MKAKKQPTDYNVRIYRTKSGLRFGFMHKLVQINKTTDEWKDVTKTERKKLMEDLFLDLARLV